MARAELQEIGKNIIKKQEELLSKHREEWESCFLLGGSAIYEQSKHQNSQF